MGAGGEMRLHKLPFARGNARAFRAPSVLPGSLTGSPQELGAQVLYKLTAWFSLGQGQGSIALSRGRTSIGR